MRGMDTNHNPYAQIPVHLRMRNRRIAELRAEGKTFAEIGQMYGLSHQRVQQIVGRELKGKAA